MAQSGRIAGGTVLAPDAGSAFHRLRVEGPVGQAASVTVLVLERPPITGSRYAITGTVRYEAVRGAGYLEMWSVFPDGGRYFSRTLAEVGPFRRLEGTSEWRPFVLPFFNAEHAPPPAHLTLNVALPGGGRVDLGPLRLVQYGPREDPLALPGQWWSDRTGGLLGAVAGSALGIIGAVIGWLGGTGRARRLVLGLTRALIGAGAVALLAGGAAWTLGQPYAVYYPLGLLGLIGTLCGAGALPVLRKRYEARELRKIRALDVR